jgi:hypothetical protein
LKGERELLVRPLTVPGNGAPGACEATALFADRARAANPELELDGENGAAVAEICRRLEGLLLALELAAARVRHLPPRAMLERLESRLELPTSGGAGYPKRQRTMRAALDSSFELLDEVEQAVFARTSVFRGGWTLTAFDETCAGPLEVDALDALASLVDIEPRSAGRAGRRATVCDPRDDQGVRRRAARPAPRRRRDSCAARALLPRPRGPGGGRSSARRSRRLADPARSRRGQHPRSPELVARRG